MSVYEMTGHLTQAIPHENIPAAQLYLQRDHNGEYLNMAQYSDLPAGLVLALDWQLSSNGYDYVVRAVTKRDLTDNELRVLGNDVSGQNSDGLGEGFEQQDFAWVDEDSEETCGDCDGSGSVNVDDDDGYELSEDCDTCGGTGYVENDGGSMCSFDWETNEHKFVKVA